jgi:hypothetical protein
MSGLLKRPCQTWPTLTVPPMIAPGVGHGQRLEDPADGLPVVGLQKQVKGIGHQAVAVQPEGIALAGLSQSGEESVVVGLVAEDGSAVVAPVQGVVEQAIRDGSAQARHGATLGGASGAGKRKMN